MIDFMKMATSMYRSTISISPDVAEEQALNYIEEGREEYFHICWLYPCCNEATQDIISDYIESNLDNLSALDLYFVLISGIKPYDKTIEGLFIKQLSEYKTEDIDNLDDENPLRWIVQACVDGFITVKAMINYDKANTSSQILKFINHPDSFDIDNFSMDWEVLLQRKDFILRYEKLKRNEEWESIMNFFRV